MNIQEAKAMEGTEFTFIFEDGDTIQAYVKKFDPEIGMSCYTLETETVMGYQPDKAGDVDKLLNVPDLNSRSPSAESCVFNQ